MSGSGALRRVTTLLTELLGDIIYIVSGSLRGARNVSHNTLERCEHRVRLFRAWEPLCRKSPVLRCARPGKDGRVCVLDL